MLDKRVRVPMMAGIIVYGISILLSVLCALNTPMIVNIFSTIEYDGRVFPITIIGSLITLALYIAFYFIMNSCKGKHNRVIGIIMLIAYCLPSIGNYFLTMAGSVLAARQGEESLVALSAVSQAISIVTLPFNLAAGVLIVVAMGRFGIIGDITASEEKMTEDNVYYGG
ncbi:MAG: hypothetical protein J6I66_00580 [Lachnospiraceae bacterium]|nr:hypothetical protein [Lachnospiraceae bacterium]